MKDKDRHLARLEQMIAAETEKKEKADKEALAFLYFLKARVELDFLVEKEGEKTDYSKARNAIDMAIQCFECARYRDVRLDILEKEEDIEAAEVEYELLDEAYGDNLYFAINYARVLRLNRKYEQAIKQLKRIDVQQVQKLEPKFYDYIASELLYLARATNAYYLYGLRNQYLEKYLAWLEEETLENYPEKYKEIDRVVGSIAIGAYRAGDYVKAIHYYRRREKAESTLPYVFYRDLGDAYLAAEDLKNALISYQIALKRVQEDEIEDKQREIRICYRNIATAYAKMQDEAHFDEAAKRACELAEEKDAREAYVADWITYYQDCGNWTKARNILDTYGKKAFDEKTYFKKLIHLKRALISDKKESKELIAFIQKNGDAFGQEFVEDEIMEIEIYDLGDIASHRHQIEQKALKNMEEESLWDARDSILEAMFACRELKLEDKLWFWAKKYLEALEEHYRLTCDMDAAEQFINEPKQRRKNLSRMMTYWGMTGNIQMLEAYVEKLLECLQCAECRGKICTERWGALGFYYEAKGDMEKALEYYRMDAKEAGQFSFSRYRVMNS
jgi:tetratricopeptide (TPR) repeat protein